MQAVCRPAACLHGVQVRLQLQNVSRGGERRYKGPVQTIGRIASEEGIMAPFKASTAAANGTPTSQLSSSEQMMHWCHAPSAEVSIAQGSGTLQASLFSSCTHSTL